MGPPDSMKTYGLHRAGREKGQKNRRVRKEFPVFDQLFAKENEDLSSKGGKKGLWNDSLDLFDLKARERKPLKGMNNFIDSTEGNLFSSANDTFDNFCSDGKTHRKINGEAPTRVSVEISGPEQVYSNSLISHSSSGNDSCLLYQSMSLKKMVPTQPFKVSGKKAWSNPWNESEALPISKNENCSDLEKHASEAFLDSRKEAEQVNDNYSNVKAISCSDQVFSIANLPPLEENKGEEVYARELRTPLSTSISVRRKLRKRTDQCPSVDLKCQHRRKILTSTPALASSDSCSSNLSKHPLRSLLEGALSPVPKDLIDDVFVSSPESSEKASFQFAKISRSSASLTSYESAVSSQSGHRPVKEQHSLTSKDDKSPVREERRRQLCSDINQKANSNFHSGKTSESGMFCDVENCSVDLFNSLGSEKERTKASECSKKTKDSLAEKIEFHENFEVSIVLRNFIRRRRYSLKTCLQNSRRNSSREVKPQVVKQDRRFSRAFSRQRGNKGCRISRPSFNCSRIRTSAIFSKYKKCRQIQKASSSEASITCNNSLELQTCRRSREWHQVEKIASNQSNYSIYQGNCRSQSKKLTYSGDKNVHRCQRFRNAQYLRLQGDIYDVNIENQNQSPVLPNEDLNAKDTCSVKGRGTDGVNEISVWSSTTCDVEQSSDYATSIKCDSPEIINSNLSSLEFVKGRIHSQSTCPTSSSSEEDSFRSGMKYLHSDSDGFATSQLDAKNSGSNCSIFPKSESLTETKGTEKGSILCSQTNLDKNEDLYGICNNSTRAKYSAENERMLARCNITSMTQSMADLQVRDECGMLPKMHRTSLKLSDHHTAVSMAHNRCKTLPWRSNLLLANMQRLSTSRRFGERRSSRKSVSQIGTLPGKSLSKAVLDPKQHVLELCGQKTPVPIQECFKPSHLKCCKKIGEGAFGEVFMTRPNPDSMDGAAVLKIMPIEGDFEVNGEHQKTFGEIVSEIIISKELSGLRTDKGRRNWCENFVHVLSSWCVVGSYLPALLDMWDQFNAEKGSENDRPDLFPDTQLYIVLEFGHGGQDLESFVFNNAGQALAIFLQIAYSLAVSEQELEFEHRDLHWGNVLVAVTSAKMMEFHVAGKTYKLKTQGVKATVIDFTLSRLRAPDCVVFNNLSQDPDLFTSEGDYQFEIYRLMKRATKSDWEKFNPYTNVLWLHYILDKMGTECYYKNIKTKVHRTNLKEIQQLKSSMLDNLSATDFVLRREE